LLRRIYNKPRGILFSLGLKSEAPPKGRAVIQTIHKNKTFNTYRVFGWTVERFFGIQ